MEKYFYRVYISEDIGVIKPLSAFFARILSDLHTTKDKCLMIGDSLESDIAGAKGAGIDSCWVNPSGRSPGEILPDYTVRELAELLSLLV